ncbi:serine/threonine-protein kinase [Streptomyces sp. NPDC002784]
MHRDIKPSNIIITPSGIAKVLDFGIARAIDPYATANRLTQTGFIVGTPPYMAPEQARGFPEPRSDLYALGCLLFELITCRLPFQAPDTVGYLSAHLTQEPPAPSSVHPGIPSSCSRWTWWWGPSRWLCSPWAPCCCPSARWPDAGCSPRPVA